MDSPSSEDIIFDYSNSTNDSFLSNLRLSLESLNFNDIQEGLFALLVQPYNYVVHEVPLSTKLLTLALVIFVLGVLIPWTVTSVQWVKAVCHPITFSYKHVLITGGG